MTQMEKSYGTAKFSQEAIQTLKHLLIGTVARYVIILYILQELVFINQLEML